MAFTTVNRREVSGFAYVNVPSSKTRRRIDSVMAGLTILFLLLDSLGKLLLVPQVVEESAQLGYPAHILFPVYLGALIWGSLLLREDRLRPLMPLRR